MANENQKQEAPAPKAEKKVLIHQHEARVLSFPVSFTKDMVTSEIHLIPGINEVSESVLKQMQKHPVLRHQFEDGSLEVLEDGSGEAMEGLPKNEKAALKIVADCNNLDLLHQFLDTEKRAAVKRAIEKKIKEIDEPTGKKDEE